MKQALLDFVEGDARCRSGNLCSGRGCKVYTVPEGVDALPLIAIGNTVILWQENGKVQVAQAGDPLEIEA